WRRRRRAGTLGQDAHEADDVGSHRLVHEMILRHEPNNLAARADRDPGIKGKPAFQFGAELRPGDWPPDHQGARRADVDGIEVLQLFGERGRPEGPVTADVDPSQKNHECHAFLLLAPLETYRQISRYAVTFTRMNSPGLIL